MSSINSSFDLNLHILSFELPHNLFKDSDDIRVSITSFPDENKQAFTISARKIKDFQMKFSVNVTIPQLEIPEGFVSTATEKIIIVFRKKSYFHGDPIIAASVIFAKDLPKNLSEPAQIKLFNIYEPNHNNENNKKNNRFQDSYKKNDRKIIGKMQVQMSLTDPFHLKSFGNDDLLDLDNNNLTIDSENVSEKSAFSNNLFKFAKLCM